MKQTERKHLKENDLVHTLDTVRDAIGPRRKQLTTTVVVVVILVAVVLGVVIVRQQTANRGHQLLADAMIVLNAPVQPRTPAQPPADGKPGTPEMQQPGTFPTDEARLTAALPKLQAAADAYPTSQPGLTARYHLATALAALGRHDEALKAYDQLLSQAGRDTMYGRMARLGKAHELVRTGKANEAVTTFKEIADDKASTLPVDAVLMELASAYKAAGNADEAKKTYSRVIHEHPGSPYSQDAGKQLGE